MKWWMGAILALVSITYLLAPTLLTQNTNLTPRQISGLQEEQVIAELSKLRPPKIALLTPDPKTAPLIVKSEATDITHLWKTPKSLLRGFFNLSRIQILEEPHSEFRFRLYLSGSASETCNRQLTGHHGCEAIFYGRSKDLRSWEFFSGFKTDGTARYTSSKNISVWKPVIEAQDKFWDQWNNTEPTVLRVEDTYFLAYTTSGFNKDGYEDGHEKDLDGNFVGIGGAVSKDGVRWTKLDHPLLALTDQERQESVLKRGRLRHPSLLYQDGKFKLWFEYWLANQGSALGYAELEGPGSIETFQQGTWTLRQYENSPAIINWSQPSVLRTAEGYSAFGLAYIEGDRERGRKTAEAFSADGLHWQLRGYVDPEPGCAANHHPVAFEIDKQILLTTACQRGGNPYDPNYFEIRQKIRKTR